MRYVFIPLVIGLMAFFACVTTTDTGDGVPHDQNTVLGTLYLFVDIWNNGDMTIYGGLLDEDFTFYFAEVELSWGYEEEMEAVTNLFESVGPENVDVQLDLDDVTEPEEGAETCMVEEVPYEVYVHVSEGDYDITYIARGKLDMQLNKTGGQWFITDWWDRVSWRLLGSETSWGALKALY